MSNIRKQKHGAYSICTGLLLSALFYFSSFVSEPAARAADLCSGMLPEIVAQALAQQYAGWTIQNPSTLSTSAQERWKSEKPTACPGIAQGYFEDRSRASFALLIVHTHNQGAAAKLLLFSGSSADVKVLEDTTSGGTDFFIRAVAASRFFDSKSSDRFGISAPEAILLFDAGKNEYETDIYFMTRNGYRHEAVDY